LRIYLACPFPRAFDLARPMIKRLRDAGHMITCDWTEGLTTAATPGETTLPKEEQAKFARADLEGVREADLFWALATDLGGTGMWIETGYAQALAEERRALGSIYCPRLVVSGPPRTIFTALPGIKTFADHDEALAFILSL
jgi:nucleoside 2-deoxyribosyltransferase